MRSDSLINISRECRASQQPAVRSWCNILTSFIRCRPLDWGAEGQLRGTVKIPAHLHLRLGWPANSSPGNILPGWSWIKVLKFITKIFYIIVAQPGSGRWILWWIEIIESNKFIAAGWWRNRIFLNLKDDDLYIAGCKDLRTCSQWRQTGE